MHHILADAIYNATNGWLHWWQLACIVLLVVLIIAWVAMRRRQ